MLIVIIIITVQSTVDCRLLSVDTRNASKIFCKYTTSQKRVDCFLGYFEKEFLKSFVSC